MRGDPGKKSPSRTHEVASVAMQEQRCTGRLWKNTLTNREKKKKRSTERIGKRRRGGGREGEKGQGGWERGLKKRGGGRGGGWKDRGKRRMEE